MQTGSGANAGLADKIYDAIRKSTTDIEIIAIKTRIKPSNIEKVKTHLFYNEHLLDRYVELGVPEEAVSFVNYNLLRNPFAFFADKASAARSAGVARESLNGVSKNAETVRLNYEAAPYHKAVHSGAKSPSPTNGARCT